MERVGLRAGPFCFGVLIRRCLLPGAAFGHPRLRPRVWCACVSHRPTARTLAHHWHSICDDRVTASGDTSEPCERWPQQARHQILLPMVITAIISRFLEG